MADIVNATNATAVVRTTADDIHLAFRNMLQHSGSPFLGQLTQNNVVFFLVMVIAAFALSYAFVLLSKTVVKAITSRTKTDLDDLLLDKLQHPVALSIFVLLLSVALVPLSLSNRLADVFSVILVSCNIFLLGVIASRALGILILHVGEKITAKTESTVDDQLLPLVKRLTTVVVYVVAFLFIFSAWGVQIAPLLAGAGIAGLAIAFAMQESLKNVFGGISLAFDKAYGIGDLIKLSDGTVGTVIDISLRSTKIRTPTGDLITIPNGKIANENFQNYAQPTHETRVLIQFSVAYGTDIDKVKSTALGILRDVPDVMEHKAKEPVVELLELGAYSLNFRLAYWVHDYSKSWDSKIAATEKLYNALRKNKIELPFPTQTVFLKK